VERTLKASLASVGGMLGIPPCSDPTCPRVYPHNLEELDAASLKLCDACQQGFRLAHQGTPMPAPGEIGTKRN
jgi:predicted Zn-dependent protease